MAMPIVVTFILYFIFMFAIGLFFYKRSKAIDDYLLGGRAMGSWVTALSAQASDMSGWLLMGLPGAIYMTGFAGIWIAVGLFIGTVLNWKLVAVRLRIYTQKTDSITLPCFFEQRFADPTGLLRIVSAIVILLFFTIYVSSGLIATGKLFESTFGISYITAVVVGGTIVISYTFLGGFMAVCWTDFFQGSLMIIALMVVPIMAYMKTGGSDAIINAMKLKNMSLSIIPVSKHGSIIAVISAMAWGLGYFGQPHILARFMGIKSVRELSKSMVIAIIWVFISLVGAVVIGLISIPMFDNLSKTQSEKVFIYMIGKIMHPWIGGVMLAAILSAIMSTIDSQLLVASSALTEDFYQKIINKKASQKQLVLIGRLCVIIISAIAMFLALSPNKTILGIVAYAWGGFGAAFGPVVLFALFSGKTSWQSALAGIIAGTIVLMLWKNLGLSEYMYEIVPAFAANCITIVTLNLLLGQKNQTVIERHKQLFG